MQNHHLFLFLINFCCINLCLGSERDVVLSLFNDYKNLIRPVKDTATITFVGTQLRVLSLLEVNGQQEYIRLAVSLKLNWTDEYLTWNPADFNGTDYVRAYLQQVWHPDMGITTKSLQSEQLIEKEEILVRIHYNGDVDYANMFLLTNSCPMQNDHFPFDSQTCIIRINSGSYPSKFVQFQHVAMSNTLPVNQNTEWEILPYTVNTTDQLRIWADEEEIYRGVRYFVSIKRKPAYYIWVIIVPTFIITALSITGIFAPFSSTGEREERVTLGLTSLLTLAIILSLVTTTLPKGTKLPILGIFILLELIICAVSVLLAVTISYFHERATSRSWSIPERLLRFSSNAKHQLKENVASEHQFTVQKHINDRTVQKKGNDILSGMQHLDQTLFAVRNWLGKHDEDESRNKHWIIIFDKIDFIFFAFFHLINIALFVYTLW